MFVTLKKTDKNFSEYLFGVLPKGHRAIPVQTLNLGLENEVVTFDCRPIHDIKRPSKLVFLSLFIKLRSYSLIMLPLLYVIVKNFIDERFRDPFSLSFAVTAMFFIYAGLNIRNDISDHISGFDRVNIPYTDKPILKGWISAKKANFYSWFFIFIGALISIPTLILQPEELRVLFVVLVLILIGQFSRGSYYKEKHLGELILFLLIGPGLVSGYQVALGAGVDTEILAFGVLWGFAVLFLLHVNNFCHLMTSSQAGIKNSMTRMGFDRAKRLLWFWWVMLIILYFIFHKFYASTFWTWFGAGLLSFWSFPLLIEISRIRSPVGSELMNLRKTAHLTFNLMILIFTIELVWYAGVKLNWTL